MAHIVGNKERLFADISDIDQDPIDPTTVVFKVKDPAGTITTYTYGVDAAVIRTAEGSYYMDLLLDQAGTWLFSCNVTGTNTGYRWKGFDVEEAGF